MKSKKEAPAGNGISRPYPPQGMGTFPEQGNSIPSFIPAKDISKWVTETFIADGAPLYNEDHKHLLDVPIDFLWAAGGFNKQMRRVIGQTEQVAFRCSAWQKGRQEQQFIEWYGYVPSWLITLDASFCATCSDEEFCALIEHELYHIGQDQDQYGQPKFDRYGMPSIKLRGHDVEEFVGVVRRYGASHEVQSMVDAAKQQPEVSRVKIAHACGTCHLRIA